MLAETARVREIEDRLEKTPYLVFLASLGEEALHREVEEKSACAQHEIIESEDFACAMADTNASGYEVDELSIHEVDLSDTACHVTVAFVARGESDGD